MWLGDHLIKGEVMKVGSLVRALGFDFSRLFIVLETRTSPSMVIGREDFREERTDLRLHCSENPFLEQSWSNADFFELVSE